MRHLAALIAVLGVTVSASPAAFAQFSQQGPKLVGAGAAGVASQGYSVAVSADGTTAIIGGPGDDGGAGAVWIWTRSGNVWTQQGSKLVGSNAVGPANQGHSVSISADGNTAIVGGPDDDNHVGAIWVWTRSEGVWTQQGPKLVAADGKFFQAQGDSVSLSAEGNTAIVGGPYDNGFVGAAWIWIRSAGVWIQQGPKLVGSGAAGVAPGHGTSVSLSSDGNTAIVGAPFDEDASGHSQGAAWVWTRNIIGVWTQQGPKLVGSGAVNSFNFGDQGTSVSLSSDGDTAIVGGSADDDFTGAVWVWTRSDGIWTQQGPKLVGSGAISKPLQGDAVSLSADGDTAAVGGWGDNNEVGAVWIWARRGGVWTQQGDKLVGSDAAGTARQGNSVSLSADGNTAIFGGVSDNFHVGAAWVFTNTSASSAPTDVVATAATNVRINVIWTAVAGADSYDIYRKAPGGAFTFVGNRLSPAYADDAVTPDTSYLYKVRAVYAGGTSPDSNVDLATTTIFADDPLAPGTIVQAAHLIQLRTAVNAVRTLAGLSAATFTYPGTAGTTIHSIDVGELRTALDAARNALFLSALTYSNNASVGTIVRAIDFTEIRNGTK